MQTARYTHWLAAQSASWLGLLAAFSVLEPQARGGWAAFAIAGYAAISLGWLWVALRSGSRVADWATLARSVGVIATTFWAISAERVTWAAWVLYVLFILADLLDGWLARRFGGSEAGAVLDMEADQLACLLLAVASVLAGVGPWVLGLPGLKYAFALGMRKIEGASDPKPCDGDNRRARLIAAATMTLLLASLAPPTPPTVRSAFCALALVLLTSSFLGDLRFLINRRGRA